RAARPQRAPVPTRRSSDLVEGDLTAGEASQLTMTVTRDGEPVTELEPYLGAFGHLVALRDGDLAYLHVHPHEDEQVGQVPVAQGDRKSTRLNSSHVSISYA